MYIQHLPGDIYVTKLDYERLSTLVQQPLPASAAAQVAVLKRELKRAHLVDSYDILPHVVTMNSRFRLGKMRSSEELDFTLVYPPDADASGQRLSVLSSMGVAVLGCRLGDQFQLNGPDGLVSYWVEAILHQPEAAGDWVS